MTSIRVLVPVRVRITPDGTRDSGSGDGGRYWARTSDLTDVNRAL